jgi:lambda family phage minor tail protein L
MAEKIAIKEIQGLEQASPLVTLYEIELDSTGSSKLYYVNSLESDLTTVQLYDYDTNTQLNTYDAIPIIMEGFEHKSTGPTARPVIRLGNVTATFATDLGSLSFQDLLGFKVHRRRTYKKYLKGEASDPGSGATPVEFPRETYVIDRIETEDAQEIAFELTTPFDLEGLMLPYRVIGHNACSWIYQGASASVAEKDRRGGCIWNAKSKYLLNGTIYTAYVNEDDEYVITSGTSFTTYSSSGTEDGYYSTTTAYSSGSAGGVYRLKADGSFDTSVTGNLTNYWQAAADSSGVTPADGNSNWHRIRVYGTYSNSNTYYAYSDDRYNDYVVHNNLLWKAKRTQASGGDQVAPSSTATEFWTKGDICGKRLSSCSCRFGFNPINPGTASSTGKASKDTSKVLPFGGFPGARKFK